MTGLSVVFAVVALGATWLLVAWRGLVSARAAADAAWAGIDLHLRERHALVAPLAAAVQAEAPLEDAALARLVAARDAAATATTPWARAEAERHLVAGLASTTTVAEAHPTLAGTPTFVDLQARLASIEDAIQAARRVYNADVRLYRTRRSGFPGGLVRRFGAFEDRPYFELDHTRHRAGAAPLPLVRAA